jgi:hypothetical protein
VTLTAADTATPSFTYRTGTTAPLTFHLTVTGPGGSDTDTDTVVVSGVTDQLTLGAAKYVLSRKQYDIRGTATVTDTNEITIHKGATLSGPVTGKMAVDNLGAWRFRGTGSIAVIPGDHISIESSPGGQLLDQHIQVGN